MAKRLSKNDKERIALAISELESRTAAELAVVIAHRSHDYAAYPFLWAAGLALLIGGSCAVAWPNSPALEIALIQGAVFILSYLAIHFSSLGLVLVPSAAKREHAERLAQSEFAALVERRTTTQLGALLFVSIAERQIEILVDYGIQQKISPARWHALIEHFRSAAKTRPLTDAVLAAIGDCAALLAEHFPPELRTHNQIPNTVREA